MRIAIASKPFLPNVGGVETSTAMMARTWTAAGHEVQVVTATPDPQPAPSKDAFQVTRDWSLRTLLSAFRRADIAVTNGYSRAAVLAAALGRRRIIVFHQGYQLICSDGLGFRMEQFHGFDPVKDLKLAFAAGPSQGARAVGRLPFDAAVKRWPHGIDHVVPSHHVARRLQLAAFDVIYQPPNPAVIDAIAALGAPSVDERSRAKTTGDILFLGRLVFEKGCDDLIRAFAAWRRRVESAGGSPVTRRLVIHGRGPELPKLERVIAELGLGAHVDLLPFLGGRDLARAARAAAVVVVPSRWEEPGATLAVELFACGAAVIASRLGAQGEIFAEHGRLFDNGDVEDLTSVLESHFRDGPIYPRPTGAEPWLLPAIQHQLREALSRTGASG